MAVVLVVIVAVAVIVVVVILVAVFVVGDGGDNVPTYNVVYYLPLFATCPDHHNVCAAMNMHSYIIVRDPTSRG